MSAARKKQPVSTFIPALVPVIHITEIIGSDKNTLLLPLIAPLLRYSTHQHNDRWLVLVNPPAYLDRTQLQEVGVDLTRIMVLHANSELDTFHLTKRSLASGKAHTIISWLNFTNEKILGLLEIAAEQGNSQGLVIKNRA